MHVIDRCQIFIGEVTPDCDRATVVAAIHRLVASIPLDLSGRERVVLRGVLAHILARVVIRTGIDGDSALVRALIAVAATSTSDDEWRASLDLLDTCTQTSVVSRKG